MCMKAGVSSSALQAAAKSSCIVKPRSVKIRSPCRCSFWGRWTQTRGWSACPMRVHNMRTTRSWRHPAHCTTRTPWQLYASYSCCSIVTELEVSLGRGWTPQSSLLCMWGEETSPWSWRGGGAMLKMLSLLHTHQKADLCVKKVDPSPEKVDDSRGTPRILLSSLKEGLWQSFTRVSISWSIWRRGYGEASLGWASAGLSEGGLWRSFTRVSISWSIWRRGCGEASLGWASAGLSEGGLWWSFTRVSISWSIWRRVVGKLH